MNQAEQFPLPRQLGGLSTALNVGHDPMKYLHEFLVAVGIGLLAYGFNQPWSAYDAAEVKRIEFMADTEKFAYAVLCTFNKKRSIDDFQFGNHCQIYVRKTLMIDPFVTLRILLSFEALVVEYTGKTLISFQ